MKLYLRSQVGKYKLFEKQKYATLWLQVEKRALEVWETLEKLEEEKELRETKREKTKTKKFNQQVKSNVAHTLLYVPWFNILAFVKDLRMAVRSSVYKKQTTSHEHVFGAEQFDADRDIYYRTCSTCSYQQEYEKMWFANFILPLVNSAIQFSKMLAVLIILTS